jgi:serine/threonine protein kinase
MNRLRERFPTPSSFDFEARGTLSDEGFKLLTGLLQLNPARRLTAQEALDHRWCASAPDWQHAATVSSSLQNHDAGSAGWQLHRNTHGR